jgi:hypothetical protein
VGEKISPLPLNFLKNYFYLDTKRGSHLLKKILQTALGFLVGENVTPNRGVAFEQVRSYSVARQGPEASPVWDVQLHVIWPPAGESGFPCWVRCITRDAELNNRQTTDGLKPCHSLRCSRKREAMPLNERVSAVKGRTVGIENQTVISEQERNQVEVSLEHNKQSSSKLSSHEMIETFSIWNGD